MTEPAKVTRFPTREDLRAGILKAVRRTRVVLDVGCGIRPQDLFVPDVHVCVDPHLPYLERLAAGKPAGNPLVLLNASWCEAMRILPDDSVETVFALDFIEHLDRGEGLQFLAEAERVARVQVVLFTPLGFYEQALPVDGTTDRWGMDGAAWQVHRSGWTPGDFHAGWQVLLCDEFHPREAGPDGRPLPTGAFWAVLDIPPGDSGATPPGREPSGHGGVLHIIRSAARRLKAGLRALTE